MISRGATNSFLCNEPSKPLSRTYFSGKNTSSFFLSLGLPRIGSDNHKNERNRNANHNLVQPEKLESQGHGHAVREGPPAIERIAPVLFARFQNRAPTNTQQNAVSKPPKANMLIFQITSGGTMDKTNTIAPIPSVTIWLERETRASATFFPFASA